MGFDSFVENEGRLEAYIPEHLVTDEIRAMYPLEECPDENWNATWEAEHTVEELPMGVKIIPHCAFGAGHHETTGMMSLSLSLSKERGLFSSPKGEVGKGLQVLDMGCGTGVLGIIALRCGAKHVTFVDIDEKSIDNTRENLALNSEAITSDSITSPEDITDKATLLCQSTVPEGHFDLILANIHRNILIEMMPDFADRLNPGGELWISGFYESDMAAIIECAAQYGLSVLATHAKEEWRMIQFINN